MNVYFLVEVAITLFISVFGIFVFNAMNKNLGMINFALLAFMVSGSVTFIILFETTLLKELGAPQKFEGEAFGVLLLIMIFGYLTGSLLVSLFLI